MSRDQGRQRSRWATGRGGEAQHTVTRDADTDAVTDWRTEKHSTMHPTSHGTRQALRTLELVHSHVWTQHLSTPKHDPHETHTHIP